MLQCFSPLFQTFSVHFDCTHPGCGATFRSKSGYQRHLKRHMGIYQYQCPYCDKGINTPHDIKTHLQHHHTGMLGFHCVHCKGEFETIHLLKTHLQKNTCQQIMSETNNVHV